MSSRFSLIKSKVKNNPFERDELPSNRHSEISCLERNFKKSKYGIDLFFEDNYSSILIQMSDVVKLSMKSSKTKDFLASK
jgi:hypothetical protein